MKQKIKAKKDSTKGFKCHICGTIIFTTKKKELCKNCKNEYILKDGKYYRQNIYGKWARHIEENCKKQNVMLKNATA